MESLYFETKSSFPGCDPPRPWRVQRRRGGRGGERPEAERHLGRSRGLHRQVLPQKQEQLQEGEHHRVQITNVKKQFCEVLNEGMVWVLDLSWGRNLSFVSISRLGRHAQPPCTTCKSLRLNLYNCESQVDCAFHLHLVLRLAHIVLRLVLVCLCACVLVYLFACVPNLAKSTRLASWKALKKPSSGPMHEHWAPKEVSLGFNFEFCKCKWWTLNKPFMI